MINKHPLLPEDIEWHFIGHLQRNKVKYIIPFVSLIEAVDSMRLLREINKEALKNSRTVNCLLQFYIATEETKFGLDLEEAFAILDDPGYTDLNNICITGVMGMATFTDDEIKLVSETGTHILHCPESNLKLASGFCPAYKLQQAGVNISIGTDGAASNNDLDMLAEMRTAALIAKAVAKNACALPAEDILRMATINGAKALGLEKEIGSIEIGKAADITTVDLSGVENQPVYNPVSQLVYSAGRENISNVWVAGNHLLKDRQLTTLDEKSILEKTAYWQEKIKD